ncbi:uncharacterized protein EV154DRAFT_491507 [Mucor mucedo]|uniref:uncharacterized protein n=1 Tax=Mucor mucedo TaxID=29922 RepID=UPI0022205C31|nr:uncharacterized protein EV154DRAFT_491507 [Mucor mucedo]KAI7896580.1 hypothetical protein EV154DRAFT_491507 [Mucor mucedo]
MLHTTKRDHTSIYSNDSTVKTLWHRFLAHFYAQQQQEEKELHKRRHSTYSSSESDLSSVQTLTKKRRRRKARQEQVLSLEPTHLVLPPFSPTYCKKNEFPYSNFYVKLPNGKWMIRYRSGNRDILGTEEFEGYMI